MKTLSHPNLPILQNHKINNQAPMKFPKIAGGFKTAFCLKQIPNDLKFKAIVDGLYNYLEIKYLKTMTMNKQNYLEIKQSSFIACCSYCFEDITSSAELKKCGTVGCTYIFCSRPECNHCVDNSYFCNYCYSVKNQSSINTNAREFIGNTNDDCVTIYRNKGEDMLSVANTLLSVREKSLFENLPDYIHLDSFVVPVKKPLESIVPPQTINISNPTISDNSNMNMDSDSNDSETSITSDVCCNNDPVEENIKQYLMKGGSCVLDNSIETRYDYTPEFHSCEMLEVMNEKWKSEVILSCLVYKRKIMNGFIDWQLWIKDVFPNEVVRTYRKLKKEANRNTKTQFFETLYEDKFLPLNAKRFFMLKSQDKFQLITMTKLKFLNLIKSILSTKVANLKKYDQSSLQEIILYDENNYESFNHEINVTKKQSHEQDSVPRYYQKKNEVNFILTNETKFMSPHFLDRVHEHITSSTYLPNVNGCKYNICQIKNNINAPSKYVEENISKIYVKESRFSFI